jgi:hypothetical protein
MGKQIDEKSGFDPSFMMKLHDMRKQSEKADKEKEAKGKKKPPASAKKEELLRELERLESTPSPFPEARERRMEQLRTILERGGGMDPSFMMKLSDLRKKKEAEDEKEAAKAKGGKKKK